MTDRPIIFSAPMVRALLEGRKTQTRRIAWRDAGFGLQDLASEQLEDIELRGWDAVGEGNEGLFRVYKPTAWRNVEVGDRLWVRESAYFTIDQGNGKPAKVEGFFADGPNPFEGDHTVEARPSIHMPRWASRLTLIVTGVKVERLQDISEADAIAEGADPIVDHGTGSAPYLHRIGFEHLWGRINGETAWLENPFVVAISFKVIKANIDAVEALAA